MSNIVDLARARRSRCHWGGLVVIRPDEIDVTAEMVDFWGDDLREPPERLRMWATALEDLSRQMRESADQLQANPHE